MRSKNFQSEPKAWIEVKTVQQVGTCLVFLTKNIGLNFIARRHDSGIETVSAFNFKELTPINTNIMNSYSFIHNNSDPSECTGDFFFLQS